MKKVESLVKKLNPNLDRHDTAFECVVVAFVAALYTGPDINKLIAFTGYLRKPVIEVSRRMHDSGLWENGVVHSEDIWAGEELKPSGLWLTGEVAKGRFIARRRPDGVWEYSDLARFGHWQGRFAFRDSRDGLPVRPVAEPAAKTQWNVWLAGAEKPERISGASSGATSDGRNP